MYIWERERQRRGERERLGCTVRVAWRRTVLDERENGWTTFWDSTHGSVCVCLWSIGWKWLHYIHMGGGGGGSANIYIDVWGVSLTLEACLLRYCTERVCSPWTHVWMFLGSFLHIPTLWHVGSLNVMACKVTRVTVAQSATVPALFLFCVRCCVYLSLLPSSGGWRVE